MRFMTLSVGFINIIIVIDISKFQNQARERRRRIFQRAQPFQKADNESQNLNSLLSGDYHPSLSQWDMFSFILRNVFFQIWFLSHWEIISFTLWDDFFHIERCFQFFVNSFAYYGLTMNIGDLAADNVYLNFTVSGLTPWQSYNFYNVEFFIFFLVFIAEIMWTCRAPWDSKLWFGTSHPAVRRPQNSIFWVGTSWKH